MDKLLLQRRKGTGRGFSQKTGSRKGADAAAHNHKRKQAPGAAKTENKKIKFAAFAEKYITSRERILSRSEMVYFLTVPLKNEGIDQYFKEILLKLPVCTDDQTREWVEAVMEERPIHHDAPPAPEGTTGPGEVNQALNAAPGSREEK